MKCLLIILKWVFACIFAALLILVVIGWCSRLPSLEGRTASSVIFDTGDTRLGKSISPKVAAHPGLSGIYPLADSRDAFAARAILAEAAERTLDIQYYIWEKDMTGTLLFEALHRAADRGVRVRLLLDDNSTSGLDPILSALDSQPNIEVRIFNPFVIRKPRIGYLTDFFRANRRMHNKSFTADNQVTIVGGRNIGDEYFGATEGLLFVDLDVLAVGPVVSDVSRDFDRYWASASSYPADRILPAVNPAKIAEIAAAAFAVEHDPAAIAYVHALRQSPSIHDLMEGRLPMDWARTHMVSDDPAKGLGRAAPEALFPEQLREVIGEPSTDVELVAAYFVPGTEGVDSIASLVKRGLKVRVLTNSLAASEGPYVPAGYTKYRKALLKAGVILYEMRRLTPDPRKLKSALLLGSSGTSLHAKTFSVDRTRFFVGSFNFDPRSRKLNTELGFVIDSHRLAQEIEDAFNRTIPANAYEVRLSDAGKLYWIERRDGELVRHDTEPDTSVWYRAAVWFISLLPIEGLL